MSLDRNAIATALFALGCSSSEFKTTGQREQMWSSTPEQPALFLRSVSEEYPEREVRMSRVKVTLQFEFWIYYRTTDPNEAPGIQLDALITALEETLRPGVMQQAQTLGLPYVSHCWIRGRILKDSGALTGQAIARIPVEVLAIS